MGVYVFLPTASSITPRTSQSGFLVHMVVATFRLRMAVQSMKADSQAGRVGFCCSCPHLRLHAGVSPR